MQIFSRAVLRVASVASRPIRCTPITSTRLLSTKTLLPTRSLTSQLYFQRRFNSTDAEKGATVTSEAVEDVAETASDPIIEATTTPATDSLNSAIPPGAKSIGWQIEPNSTVYVGNLFFDAKEDDIREFFGKYGNITKLDLITDVRGYSKGFCFVQYENQNAAAAAVNEAHGQSFAGRRVAVNFAAKRQKPQREPGQPSSTLFIGNLSYDITDKELNNIFRPLRNIRDVRVAIDRRTGQPRGFAHADFYDTESATEAKAKLENKEVRGRTLKIDYGLTSRVNNNNNNSHQGEETS